MEAERESERRQHLQAQASQEVKLVQQRDELTKVLTELEHTKQALTSARARARSRTQSPQRGQEAIKQLEERLAASQGELDVLRIAANEAQALRVSNSELSTAVSRLQGALADAEASASASASKLHEATAQSLQVERERAKAREETLRKQLEAESQKLREESKQLRKEQAQATIALSQSQAESAQMVGALQQSEASQQAALAEAREAFAKEQENRLLATNRLQEAQTTISQQQAAIQNATTELEQVRNLSDQQSSNGEAHEILERSLFSRLLQERFATIPVEDVGKLLKIDTRVGSMVPKSDIERVLRKCEAQKRAFTMKKAWSQLDEASSGSLSEAVFQEVLQRLFELDAADASLLFSALAQRGGTLSTPELGLLEEEAFVRTLGRSSSTSFNN
jgi:chromosome segregation ATPase